jgi:hypothetical protein
MQVTMGGMAGPVIDQFLDNVTEVMKNNSNWEDLSGKDKVSNVQVINFPTLFARIELQGRIYSVLLYEAAYLYFLLFNETRETDEFHNGALMAKRAHGKSFQGEELHGSPFQIRSTSIVRTR